MQILGLAKELGIPYERLLQWCRDAGLPYRTPDDEVEPQDEGRARSAFALRGEAVPDEASEDAALLLEWMEGDRLDLEGFPRTLEELEALEHSLFNAPERSPHRDHSGKQTSREGRLAPREILETYGIKGKSALKKVRRILPDHLVRLLHREKLDEEQVRRLREGIEERLPLCCGDPVCTALLEERYGREAVIPVHAASACRICRGAPTKRGLEQAAHACARAGIRRILVIGGSPGTHNELKQHAPSTLEFRLIPGNVSRDRQRAAADLEWCDAAFLWAGTILDHKVSQQYTRIQGKGGDAPVRVVKRRSIEALCEVIVRYARDRMEP